MFLDTSIIIEYYRSDKGSDVFKKIYDYVKDDNIYISIIQLGEISDYCYNNQIEPETNQEFQTKD